MEIDFMFRKIFSFFSSLIVLIFVIIGISFAYLNAKDVVFNYYLGEVQLPLSLLLILALGLGMLLGCFALIPGWLKLKKEIARLKRELKSNTKA